MHKALQGYLSLSCCYITVDYPVAMTIPNAILFLAHTTTTVPFCFFVFLPHLCSQQQYDLDYTILYIRVILDKGWIE